VGQQLIFIFNGNELVGGVYESGLCDRAESVVIGVASLFSVFGIPLTLSNKHLCIIGVYQ